MVAVAIGGAALVGGAASVSSGNKAAKAQKEAADQSVAKQRRQYDQSRADLEPFRTTGYSALNKLSSLYGVNPNPQTGPVVPYGGFEATPGYQFRRDEGLKAIERSASARGLLASGGALKAQQRFGDNIASAEFENYANRLANLAGVGQNATSTGIEVGQNTANNISNAFTNAGNARASSYINTGNAITGTLNNLASVYAFGQGGGFGGNQSLQQRSLNTIAKNPRIF